MKNLTSYLFLILSFGLASAQNLSSEVIATAGERFTSNTAYLDWTLGEVMTEPYLGTIVLTQGFHQANEETTSIEQVTSSLGAINVYPNPTSGNVFIEREKSESLLLTLWDIHGRLMIEKRISTEISTLDLSSFPSGIYTLRMINDQKASLGIRIQKL